MYYLYYIVHFIYYLKLVKNSVHKTQTRAAAGQSHAVTRAVNGNFTVPRKGPYLLKVPIATVSTKG